MSQNPVFLWVLAVAPATPSSVYLVAKDAAEITWEMDSDVGVSPDSTTE